MADEDFGKGLRSQGQKTKWGMDSLTMILCGASLSLSAIVYFAYKDYQSKVADREIRNIRDYSGVKAETDEGVLRVYDRSGRMQELRLVEGSNSVYETRDYTLERQIKELDRQKLELEKQREKH